MLLSLGYLLLRRGLELAALRWRSNDFKELEIVVLRHELASLRRQTSRPALTAIDRTFLAAASQLLLGRIGDPSTAWRSDSCGPFARECLDWLLIVNDQPKPSDSARGPTEIEWRKRAEDAER